MSDDEDGLGWAINCADRIVEKQYANMGVTYSPGGEYTASVDVLPPQTFKIVLGQPPVTDPVPAPASTLTPLDVMKTLGGTQWSSGPPTPIVRAWLEFIASAYPQMRGYINGLEQTYEAWCAITIAYCVTRCGMQPPFGDGDDVNKWAYVDAWQVFGLPASSPQTGDIVIVKGGGIHHITLFLKDSGNGTWRCLGGNQGHQVQESNFNSSYCTLRRPSGGTVGVALPADPMAAWPEIENGATGAAVSALQQLLGVDVDGEFGPDTDAAVRAYQAGHGLDVDGVVGVSTWNALLTKTATQPGAVAGSLPPDALAKIDAAAVAFPTIHWTNGVAPIGFIKGACRCFGAAMLDLRAGDSTVAVMAAASSGDTAHDVIAYYAPQFRAAGLSTAAGVDALRSLTALMMDHATLESSGDCYTGVDTSAAAGRPGSEIEAGLWQQSQNSFSCSPELPKVFAKYRAGGVDCYLSTFREGLHSSKSQSFGSGDALAFQELAKTCPRFSYLAAGVCLRKLRGHFGPINTDRATVRPQADALLRQVQTIVDAIPREPDEVLPPIKKPTDPPIAPENPLGNPLVLAGIIALISNLKGQHMTIPNFDLGRLLAELPKVLALLQDPILQRLLSDQPVRLSELKTLPPEFKALLHDIFTPAGTPLLPAPAVDPSKPAVDPAVPVVPPPPVTPALQRPSVQLSAVGGAIAWLAQLLGGLPPPVDMATGTTSTAGLITTILPIITAVVGSTGAFGKLLSGLSTAFGAFRPPAPK